MKSFLNQNWSKIITAIVLVVIVLFVGKGSGIAGDYVSEIKNPFSDVIKDNTLPLGDTIVCEFSEESTFSIQDGETFITHKSGKNSKPITLTFINLKSDRPQMKGNLDTVDLIPVNKSSTALVLAEKSGAGDLIFYTIFPKERTAVWQKAYSILGSVPFSLNTMGHCY